MISNISINRGDREQFFAIGGKLMHGKKEIDVEATRIIALFGYIRIYFSDKTSLTFKGFPYSYAKTNLWRRTDLPKGKK